MTTAITPSLGLLERVRHTLNEQRAAEELRYETRAREMFERARERLVQFAADVLSETIDPASVQQVTGHRSYRRNTDAAIAIGGFLFTQPGWLSDDGGPFCDEPRPVQGGIRCGKCDALTEHSIRLVDDLVDLLEESNLHEAHCHGPEAPFVDPVTAATQACVAAWEAYGQAKAREMLLEDQRPFIKAAAVLRLIESKQATSATAAEKIVEMDAEYMAHRVKQRDAVINTQRALGLAKAADIHAQRLSSAGAGK